MMNKETFSRRVFPALTLVGASGILLAALDRPSTGIDLGAAPPIGTDAGVTAGVATMWCAYLFAIIALISLPKAINSGDTIVIVSWIAQTFLQLVLLSIIMVGQSVSSAKLEQTINETHEASLGEFELAKEARETARKELAELKIISAEIHRVIKDLEEKVK